MPSLQELYAELSADPIPLPAKIPVGALIAGTALTPIHQRFGMCVAEDIVYSESSDLSGMVYAPPAYVPSTTYHLAKSQRFSLPRHLPVLERLLPVLTPGVTSGTDPELFVVDQAEQVIPAWSFLPKHPGAGSTYAPYWDGFQAEFGVGGGACLDGLCGAVFNSLTHLRSQMPKGSKLSLESTLPVPQAILDSAEEKFVALGCAPSLNAYNHQGMLCEDPRSLRYRFAGGHCHFGFGRKVDDPRIVEAVKMMDAIVGIASISLSPDENPLRRQFYGLAGEYRLPKHGLEYRTLSNYWLRSPELFYLTFCLARKALQLGWSGFRYCYQGSEEEIRQAINQHDTKLARELIVRNQGLYEAIFTRSFGAYSPARKARILELILQGAAKWFPSSDIAANWRLATTSEYSYSNEETSGRISYWLARQGL